MEGDRDGYLREARPRAIVARMATARTMRVPGVFMGKKEGYKKLPDGVFRGAALNKKAADSTHQTRKLAVVGHQFSPRYLTNKAITRMRH